METIGVISISIIGILIFIILSNNQRRNVLIFFAFIFLVNLCNLSNEDEKQTKQESKEIENLRNFKKETKIGKPIQNNFYNNNQINYNSKPKKKYLNKNTRLVRVGAECYDGTISHSNGRGTCSYHGGVKNWLYEEEEIY
jgi:hypothetical protein